MSDNERIAKWLGAKEADSDLGNLEVGDVVLRPDGGQLFSVGYITEQAKGKMVSYRPWSPDNDSTLWLDLFQKIDTAGMRQRFMYFLWNITGIREAAMTDEGSDAVAWGFMQATTAQLTAALVNTICDQS